MPEKLLIHWIVTMIILLAPPAGPAYNFIIDLSVLPPPPPPTYPTNPFSQCFRFPLIQSGTATPTPVPG